MHLVCALIIGWTGIRKTCLSYVDSSQGKAAIPRHMAGNANHIALRAIFRQALVMRVSMAVPLLKSTPDSFVQSISVM